MSILCSISAIKELPRTIKDTEKNIIFDSEDNILAIHVTGVVSFGNVSLVIAGAWK